MTTTTSFNTNCRLVVALIALIGLSMLSGCSAFGPQSQARTIGKYAIGSASPLDKDSNAEHQQKSKLFGRAANLGIDYTYPGKTLSGLKYESLVSSILVIGLDMATPDPDERTFIYGWMPRESGQTQPEAADKVLAIEQEATLAVLDEMGIDYELYLDSTMDEDDPEDYHRNIVYVLEAPEYHCHYIMKEDGRKDSNCAVTIRSGFLTRTTTPEFATNANKPAWELSYGAGNGPVVRFINNKTQLPTVELHQKISERLPEWAYMFMPDSPNYLVVDENAQFKGYPYFLQQGKELHFITPPEPEV